MKSIFTSRALLLAGCAGLASLAAPVAAQTGPGSETIAEDDDANDNRIVVTARRRKETLLEVPLSVTAISGEDLVQQFLPWQQPVQEQDLIKLIMFWE